MAKEDKNVSGNPKEEALLRPQDMGSASPSQENANQHESQSEDYYGDEALNRPRSKKDVFSARALSLNLPTPQRPGFMRTWVVDRERKLYDLRDWKPVKGEDGKPMVAVMNKNKDKPDYGTYMEIPEHYYQENMRADDAERKRTIERRIKNEDIVGEDGKSIPNNAFYTPTAFGPNHAGRKQQ